MTATFFIVDDDDSIREILIDIIEEYCLGKVLGHTADGARALEAIVRLNPDIVLVDLFLPNLDGIEMIKQLKTREVKSLFIMISQASSERLITQAYENGIEFFIHKPLNVVEVVTVIRKVLEALRLKRYISVIQQTVQQFTGEKAAAPAACDDENELKRKVARIFSDLGILGEAGSSDITNLILIIHKERQKKPRSYDSYQLSDLYARLGALYGQDSKTVEQRVRRTVAKALQNLAGIGLEDYYNEKFTQYSTALFDFQEIKQEMNFLKGKSPYRGKINAKKFLEGIIYQLSE